MAAQKNAPVAPKSSPPAGAIVQKGAAEIVDTRTGEVVNMSASQAPESEMLDAQSLALLNTPDFAARLMERFGATEEEVYAASEWVANIFLPKHGHCCWAHYKSRPCQCSAIHGEGI